MNKILEYYSRKDVQSILIESAKDREVGIKFNDTFGKRPDVLQYENDVYELTSQGATSFHISQERWSNPLLLRTGMTKSQLDDLRIGWDLIIDVDGKTLEYSKIVTFYLLEALKFHNIKNISVKYSGNKGFHIGIPFESFPRNVNNQETKDLFPEGVKIIASYLVDMIRSHVNEKIQDFDKKKLVEIDSLLISSRHMFRAPYSINEKSGLVSIPINPNNILDFDVNEANVENVKVNRKFLDRTNISSLDASSLIIQAFDWFKKQPSENKPGFKEIKIPEKAINEIYFPPCIKLGLMGLDDGKKRFLFILLNFLKNTGYDYNSIEKIVLDWNKKNKEPLRENYVMAQVSWHKRQKQAILPPNCPSYSDMPYYKEINICQPDGFCKFIKNPVNYSIRKSRQVTTFK